MDLRAKELPGNPQKNLLTVDQRGNLAERRELAEFRIAMIAFRDAGADRFIRRRQEIQHEIGLVRIARTQSCV